MAPSLHHVSFYIVSLRFTQAGLQTLIYIGILHFPSLGYIKIKIMSAWNSSKSTTGNIFGAKKAFNNLFHSPAVPFKSKKAYNYNTGMSHPVS